MTEWNAAAYHALSDPQLAWGRRVLERAGLRGDETVLDIGCGSGRLTVLIADAVPAGQVVGLDRSANMVETARAHVARPNARFVRADATELPLLPVFDVVFSTATFHWIQDHERLFAGIHRVLRPGGRLTAQCGGLGNLDLVHGRARAVMDRPPFARWFHGWPDPWRFASPEVTEARLVGAGFERARAWLEDAPTDLPDEATWRAFVETVVFRLHLAQLPNRELRDAFLDAVADASRSTPRPWRLDYVRLNIDAACPT